MAWHYVNENREQSEVPDDDLEALVAAGSVTRETLIWQDGMADWLPAGSIRPELFGDEPAAPVPYTGPSASPAAAYTGAQPSFSPEPPTSGVAIGSLVCGILSLVACGPLSAIPGAVCGHMALSQIRLANGQIGGRGMAIAGLVMSYIALALTLLLVFFYLVMGVAVFGAAAAGSGMSTP